MGKGKSKRPGWTPERLKKFKATIAAKKGKKRGQSKTEAIELKFTNLGGNGGRRNSKGVFVGSHGLYLSNTVKTKLGVEKDSYILTAVAGPRMFLGAKPKGIAAGNKLNATKGGKLWTQIKPDKIGFKKGSYVLGEPINQVLMDSTNTREVHFDMFELIVE